MIHHLLASLHDAIRWRNASPDDLLSEAGRRWNRRDQAGAIRLGRRAAPHSADAKLILGTWLVSDNQGPDATSEGLRWLHQAAEEGDTRAMMMISNCHFIGNGVPKDLSKSIAWARRAADAGDRVCQIELVEFYTDGKHVEPDWEIARHYARKLADAGDASLLEALEEAIRNEGDLGRECARERTSVTKTIDST